MRIAIQDAAERYQDSVFRAAFFLCKNRQDAEDICQETFLAYYSSDMEFDSEEHIRAWLLRTAMNKAKNILRQFWRRNSEPLSEFYEIADEEPAEYEELLETVLSLPARCRAIIHLYYYEDYPVKDIARILGIQENTVKSQLHRGRTLLKEKLQENWNDEE